MFSSQKMYVVVGSWCNGFEDNEWVVSAHKDKDVAEYYAALADEEERRLEKERNHPCVNKYDPDRSYAGDPYVEYEVREVPVIDREKLGV